MGDFYELRCEAVLFTTISTAPAAPANSLILRVARLMGIRALVQVFALAAVSLFITSSPVLAQTNSDNSESDEEVFEEEPERNSTIEEIVIIGSRKQSLQQVPISVTSFSAGELRELRIQNIADLSDHTPNLEINTAFAASNPTLFIRGIGLKDYNANSASAVAVYVDGIAISSPAGQLFQMFDVESVEVLRGPQGTLYGRNATAGAIVVNSFKPDGEWASNGSITYGNYNGVEIEGAISFPVFDDYLQGRIAFTFQRRDGYTKNNCSGWDPEEHGNISLTADTMKAQYFSRDNYENISLAKKGMATFHTELDMPIDRKCILKEPGDIVNIYGDAEDLRVAAADRPRFVAKHKVKGNDSDSTETLNTLELRLADGTPVRDQTTGEIRPLNARYFGENFTEGDLDNSLDPLVPNLDTFAKLKPYTNNADNWATRILLRSQFTWPTAGLELLLNVHGGQNRSDSFHAQAFGAIQAECVKNKQEGCVIITDPDDGDDETDERWVREHAYLADSLPGNWNEFECVNESSGGESGCQKGFGEKQQIVPGLINSVNNPNPGGSVKITVPIGYKGADERVGWYNRDGMERIDLMGVSLTANAEFDSYRWWIPSQLTWVNGYEWNDRFVELDGDATPGNILLSDIDDTAWQVSSEMRVTNVGDAYEWTIGYFFLHETLQAFNLFPGIRGAKTEQFFDQTLNTAAPFVSGKYIFTDHLLAMGVPDFLAGWNLKAGVRYNWENKTFALTSLITRGSGQENKPFNEAGEEATWTGVTGDVTLSYNPLESTSIYWKYSRGMKGGHFNAGLTFEQSLCPKNPDGTQPTGCQEITAVEPEFIHSFELGLKGDYLDDRLEITTAFFRYWYTDLQVFDIVNEAGSLPNNQLLAADADVRGVELEFNTRPFSGVYPPMDGFFVRAGIAWLDTEFRHFRVKKRTRPGSGRSGGNNGQFDYTGNPLIAAPKWKFSGTVNWEIPIAHYGSIVPQYSFSYRSQVALDPTAHDLLSQPAYWLHNARLAYRTPDQHIEIAAWVRNLTDKVYYSDIFDLTSQYRMLLEIYAPPRFFGVTASYDW